ncbi:MAG: hypothetical protein DI592_19355, partial [Stenotrophomonas maltophilia]
MSTIEYALGMVAAAAVACIDRLRLYAVADVADLVAAGKHRLHAGNGRHFAIEAGIAGAGVVAIGIGQPGPRVPDRTRRLVRCQQGTDAVIDEPAHAALFPYGAACFQRVDAGLQIGGTGRQLVHGVLRFLATYALGQQLGVRLEEIVEGPVAAVAHACIEGKEVDRTPLQGQVALTLLAAPGTREHAPAIGGTEVRIARAELLVLPVAAHGQVQGRMQGEAVAQDQAGAVVARVGQRGVAQDRAGVRVPCRITHCEVREAACGVGIAVRLGAPQVGVEVQPAAAGRLEAVFQVPGIGVDAAERPLDAPIVRRGQDARGHDLAVVGQGAPPGRLQLLVVVDLPGSLDQPRLLFAGGIGHFIARFEVTRQRGDVVDALVLVLLARVLVVVAAALAAGEVVAALAPGV